MRQTVPRPDRIFWVACAAFLIPISWSRQGRACLSPAPPPALVGYPQSADIGVPTDVVPFYDAPSANLDTASSTNVFVLRSSTGAAVAVSVRRTYVWTLELTPAASLDPNTTYTIEATLPARGVDAGAIVDSIAFTTGSGPSSAAPAVTGAFLQNYELTGSSMGSCDPWPTGTCIAFAQGQVVIATMVDTFGQELPGYLWQSPTLISPPIDGSNTVICVNLQTRAPNGALGQPTNLCGAGAALSTYSGTPKIACTAGGLTFTDAGLTPSGPDAGFTLNGTDAGLTPNGPDAGFTLNGTDAGLTPNGTDAGLTPNGTDAGLTPNGADAGLTPNGTASSSSCAIAACPIARNGAAGWIVLGLALSRLRRRTAVG
jgi:hypothetical protein